MEMSVKPIDNYLLCVRVYFDNGKHVIIKGVGSCTKKERNEAVKRLEIDLTNQLKSGEPLHLTDAHGSGYVIAAGKVAMFRVYFTADEVSQGESGSIRLEGYIIPPDRYTTLGEPASSPPPRVVIG